MKCSKCSSQAMNLPGTREAGLCDVCLLQEKVAELEDEHEALRKTRWEATARAEAAEAELALWRKWARGRCCTCFHADRWNDDGTDSCGDCPGYDDPQNWTPAWGKGE